MDHDRESLRLAVEDVGYELQQLVDLAREIDRQDDALRSRIPGALGYDVTAAVPIACLESALLHVRNLLAFYVRSKKSWITVKDYLPEWWPPESDALRRLRDRRDQLNAHLSHLTWERVTGRAEIGENPGWDVGQLADDALTVFTGFVAQLQRDEPEAAEWFSGTLAVTSRTLRGEWPAILPKPSPGSPLAVRRPGIKRRPL